MLEEVLQKGITCIESIAHDPLLCPILHFSIFPRCGVVELRWDCLISIMVTCDRQPPTVLQLLVWASNVGQNCKLLDF